MLKINTINLIIYFNLTKLTNFKKIIKKKIVLKINLFIQC
jgi:hypothetical protein